MGKTKKEEKEISPIEAGKIFIDYVENRNKYMELTEADKELVFKLVVDLVTDAKKSCCALFFRKLLDNADMTHTELANYIYGYMLCMNYFDEEEQKEEKHKEENDEDEEEDKKDETKSYQPKRVIDALAGILKNTSYKDDNPYVPMICDYFSISEDVLKYGRGKKYTLDMSALNSFFKDNNLTIEKVTREILKKDIDCFEKYAKRCEQYIVHSHLMIANLIQHKFHYKKQLLIEEDYSLIDEEVFMSYFRLLKDKERNAVINLMESLLRRTR